MSGYYNINSTPCRCSRCKVVSYNGTKLVRGRVLCYMCAQNYPTRRIPHRREEYRANPSKGHDGPQFLSDLIVCQEEYGANPLKGHPGPQFFPDQIACAKRLEGCPWVGNVNQMQKHFKSCQFGKVKCKYCTSWIAPADQMVHMEKCPRHPAASSTVIDVCMQQDQKTKSRLPHRDFSGEDFEHDTKTRSNRWTEQSVPVDEVSIEIKLAEKSREIESFLDDLNEDQEVLQPGTIPEIDLMQKPMKTDDMDLCRSLVPTTSPDGLMTWAVSEFSLRILDACAGQRTVLTSEPFHTSPRGYKLCLKLHLEGKGQHMSLFVVLMKGEYDKFLHWPFTHKLTISLTNQKGGPDVDRTIVPHPNSSSFRKPRSLTNRAFGFPLFFDTLQTFTYGFVKDDTILIKARAHD